MKKFEILSLISILTIVLLLSQGPAKAEGTQFEDMVQGDPAFGYAYDFVNYLTEHDIIHGYNEDGHNLFKPGNDLTRTQAAIMLVKALGEDPLPDNSKSYFPDIKPVDFAYGYIQKAYELGIFHGHENGNFGPGEKLTRLQMAYTLVNTFKLSPEKTLPTQFKDITNQSVGYDYINALYYFGISDGSNGQFMPASNISRAQFSVFVARGMNSSMRLTRTMVVASGQVHINDGSKLNIRQEPSENSAVLSTLNNGDTVDIINQVGNWYQIKYNASTAYVSADFITLGTHSDPVSPTDPVKPVTPNGSLVGRVIVLDPGHGGNDPGAIALDKTQEQLINYNFGEIARVSLEQAGATVIMTHKRDENCKAGAKGGPELQCRVDVAKANHADVFISIHSNTTDGKPTTANGMQTHYNDANGSTDPDYPQVNDYPKESKILATTIQNTVPEAMGMVSRKVIDNDLYVTRMNTVPAVLIELGFLNNQGDLNRLESSTVQKNFSTALVQALNQYFDALASK